MIEKIKKILVLLLTIIQIVFIPALMYIENISKTRAGVNHYLYFKKVEYMHKYFTDDKINIMIIFMLFILAVDLFFLIALKKRKDILIILGFIKQIFWCCIFIYGLVGKNLYEYLTYPYIMLAILINIIIDNLLIYIQIKNKGCKNTSIK